MDRIALDIARQKATRARIESPVMRAPTTADDIIASMAQSRLYAERMNQEVAQERAARIAAEDEVNRLKRCLRVLRVTSAHDYQDKIERALSGERL